MKKYAIISVVLAFCLTLSIFSGSFLSAFAEDVLNEDITTESESSSEEAGASTAEIAATSSAIPFGFPANIDTLAEFSPLDLGDWKLAAERQAGGVLISWVKPSLEYDQVAVFRSESENSGYSAIHFSTGNTEFLDGGADEKKTYYYKLYIDYKEKYYEIDGPVMVGPLASKPGVVQDLKATPKSASQIDLKWTKPDGGEPDGYKIYFSKNPAGPFSDPPITVGVVTEYAHTGLDANTTYYYKIVAYNSDGDGPESAVAQAKTFPAKPIGVKAEGVSESEIEVTWDKGSADGYNVYRSEDPSGPFDDFVGQTSDNKIIDIGLESDTVYYYVVEAYNDSGKSEQSDPASGKTWGKKPNAPQNVKVYPHANDGTKLQVVWNFLDNADEYKVYRSLTPDGPYDYVTTTPGNMIHDTGLKPGTTYYYKVSGVNKAGEGPLSDYGFGTTVTGAPEKAPTVTAEGLDQSRIRVDWSTVDGASTYNVYRADSINGNYVKIAGNVNGVTYTDTGLRSNTTYYYKVSGVSSSNLEGPLSAPAAGKTWGSPPACAPTCVRACALDSSRIQVTWYAVSGATKYKVYRATSASGPYIEIGESTTTKFISTGLEPYTYYYYKVAAVNDGGTGPQSNYACARTCKPSCSLTATSSIYAQALSSSEIQVTWATVRGAYSYIVYRSESANGFYSEIGTASGTTYNDKGLNASTTYFYKVVAIDNWGRYGPLSKYASATTLNNGGISKPTKAPQNVVANGLDSSRIQVSWNSVDGATSYRVYRSSSASGSYSLVTEVAGTYCIDSGLAANTGYYYKVSAVNSAGEGPQSNYAYGKTSGSCPTQAPTNVNAVGLNSSQIQVTWNAVSGATKYRVYRSDSASGYYILLAEVGSTSYINSGLAPDTGYYYKVSAMNGTGEGPQSNYAYGKTTCNSPTQAPTYVTATGLDTSRIQVSWNGVSGATAYRVYRSSSSNGTYSLVGEVVGTSFINSGLPANTGYYYRVSALNTSGEGPLSNYAYGKTLGSCPTQAPTCVSAYALDSSRIQVSWNGVSGATSYRVYRSTSASGSYVYVGEVSSTSFINTGLTANTGYYYRVSALNSSGEGPLSSYAYAKTPGSCPAQAPTCVSAYALDSSRIQVSWNGVSGATSYRVYRSTSASGYYSLVGTVSSTAYLDQYLQMSTGYYYKVSAVNGSGEGPMSNYAYAKTLGCSKPISAPSCVVAVALDSSRIQVSWNAVNGATSYRVYRSNSANGTYTLVGVTSDLTLINGGLVPNYGFYYKVSAVNSSGEGPRSNYAYAKTLPLAKPVGTPCLTGRVSGYNTICLSWTRASNAQTYEIYRSTCSSSGFTKIATTSSTSYANYVSSNTYYYYKVVAVGSDGTRGAFSNTICLKTPYYGCGWY